VTGRSRIAFDGAPGLVDLGERGERYTEDSLWKTIELISEKQDDIDLYIDGAEDDEGQPEGTRCCIWLHASHVDADRGDRAFHPSLKVFLSRDDVLYLRDYLNLLLKREA
jgi:hypothetical protein